MRTLSADMLLAQKWQPLWNPSTGLGQPLARIRIRNNRGSVRLYEWERWYDGAEDACYQASCVPSDGSLIRVKANVSTQVLKGSRVENPTSESAYDNWGAAMKDSYHVALAAYGCDVLNAIIGADGHVWVKWSDDCGDSWDDWVDLGDVSGTYHFCIACCFKSATDAVIIYSNTVDVYRNRWNSVTGWEGFAAWTESMGYISGCAVCYMGDYNIIITGYNVASEDGVYQTLLGDGYSAAAGNWGTVYDIIKRESTEDYEYLSPAIDLTDAFRITFVEKYTGATARSLVFWSHNPPSSDFIEHLWLEPVPFNYSSDEGLSICHNSTDIFLCAANAVYYADSTLVTVDVTTALVEYKQTVDPEGTKSKLKVVLDNTAGTYDAFAKLGWEITLELGYKTLMGDEYSSTPAFWITGWRKVSPPWFPLRAFYPYGVCGTIEIDAESMWELLSRWKARRVIEWEAGDANVLQQMTWVLSRVGLELYNASGEGELSNYEPNLKINRNYNGRWAIQYLLKLMKCKAIQRGVDFRLISCASDQASDYTYNSQYGQATILYRGHYGQGFQDPNFVQVIGDSVLEEDFAFDDIIPGYDRYTAITKPEYDVAARAAYRAEREIRQAQIRGAFYGWLQTPINAVIEPYDVVTISDNAGGVSGILRRLLKIETYYAKRQWSYRQKCTIGHT